MKGWLSRVPTRELLAELGRRELRRPSLLPVGEETLEGLVAWAAEVMEVSVESLVGDDGSGRMRTRRAAGMTAARWLFEEESDIRIAKAFGRRYAAATSAAVLRASRDREVKVAAQALVRGWKKKFGRVWLGREVAV